MVQWKGAPADEASWEDLSTFKKCFPTFHLEDKVVFAAEWSDTTQVINTTVQEIEKPNEESETNMEDPIEEDPILGKRQSKKPGYLKDYVCKLLKLDYFYVHCLDKRILYLCLKKITNCAGIETCTTRYG